MNKKILNIALGILILTVLLIYIAAEENITNSNNSEEGILPKEFAYENIDNLEIQNNSDLNLSSIKTNEPNENQTIGDENQTKESNENSLENQNENKSIINNETNNTNEVTNNPLVIYPQTDNPSSGSSSSKGNSEEEAYYIDSSELELNPDNLKEGDGNSDLEEPEKEEYTCLIQHLGKKVIEIENCEEGDIEMINSPQELEKGEFEKEVNLSSQEHFDKPLTFYTLLTTEAKEEEIRIYWVNEGDLEITDIDDFSVKYYDENENGLIDKISWIVPHLSDQIFRIVIEISKTTESEEEILLEVIGPTGQTINPIIFDINVNYSGNFSCQLQINEEEKISLFNESGEYEFDLPNGNYTWGVACFDITNISIIPNATSGNFSVYEGFSIGLTGGEISSTGERMYFLDLVKNDLKSNGTANIHSENPSNARIELRRDNNLYYTKNITINGPDYPLPLNKTLLNQAGTYNLTVYFESPSARNVSSALFYVVSANLEFNTTQIQEGQSVRVTTNIISPLEKITTLSVYYGDGGVNVSQINSAGNNINYFNHRYNTKGTYTVNLIAYIGTATFEIQKNGIIVTEKPSETDDDSPYINLLEPDDEDIIYGEIVNFSYKANDNVKIQNCTFKLYKNCASMNYCSTSDSNLVFPLNSQQRSIANNYSVQNNKEVEIALKDFEDGIYEWVVECYDNSSNYDWEISFFEIRLNGTLGSSTQEYDQKEEIEILKERADDFITADFSPEEKEILEDLNILNDTKYYKKRLLDIENFFEENYKYVSSESLREKKTEEYLEEIENIKNSIPDSIEIEESYEYIKNSIDADFEGIIEEYFQSTNTQISKSSIKKLAKINRELQNELSVSTKVKNILIEYSNRTQKITLVKKEIILNDDSYGKLLEIIPKEVVENAEGVNFLIETKVIKEDPLFEIEWENLEKEEIIYYLSNQVKPKEIEKTQTILFEDDLNKFEAGFTGFFIIEFISGEFTLYIVLAFILLVVLLFIIPFVFKKFKMIGWKKEPNVVKVLNLVEDIKRLLKEKEIEKARESYYKIKAIYPVLPAKTKAYFYKKIKEMLVRIDRKDIFNLVKEYQEAKRKWNKEDVIRLYEDIKKIYERLPEKDRKKVYDIINGY